MPEELNQLTANLRNLDISENKIPMLPPSFGQFKMLKSVNLSSNRLGEVEAEITLHSIYKNGCCIAFGLHLLLDR